VVNNPTILAQSNMQQDAIHEVPQEQEEAESQELGSNQHYYQQETDQD